MLPSTTGWRETYRSGAPDRRSGECEPSSSSWVVTERVSARSRYHPRTRALISTVGGGARRLWGAVLRRRRSIPTGAPDNSNQGAPARRRRQFQPRRRRQAPPTIPTKAPPPGAADNSNQGAAARRRRQFQPRRRRQAPPTTQTRAPPPAPADNSNQGAAARPRRQFQPRRRRQAPPTIPIHTTEMPLASATADSIRSAIRAPVKPTSSCRSFG